MRIKTAMIVVMAFFGMLICLMVMIRFIGMPACLMIMIRFISMMLFFLCCAFHDI
ncbi:hypothetical protein D3C81_2023230 [compost metagenome]